MQLHLRAEISSARATEHDKSTLIRWKCRTNLAFAALTMNDDIHLSSFEYGLGSGLFFFLGYIIFQVDQAFQQLMHDWLPYFVGIAFDWVSSI